MLGYLLISGALFLGCVATAAVNRSSLGLALFPVPVAVYLVRERLDRSLGLLMCAAFAGLATVGTLWAALYYALLAAIGLPLGIGIRRRWSYGWVATFVVGVAFALMLGSILRAWPEWLAWNRSAYDAMIATLTLQMHDAGDERVTILHNSLTWLKDHWPEVGLGMLFAQVAICACVGVSVTSAWLRRYSGLSGPRGSFREMRPTEWLVWGAILVAVLWFVDYYRPVGALRIITWNSAIGIATVYFLNGLSILAYAFAVFRPHVLVCMAVVVLLWTLRVVPVLCFVGLFDTWGNFRMKCDELAAARRGPAPPNDRA